MALLRWERTARASAVAAFAAAIAAAAATAPDPAAAQTLSDPARQLDAVNQLLRTAPGPLPAQAPGDPAQAIPEGAEGTRVPISAIAFTGRDGAPLTGADGLPLDALRARTAGLVSPSSSVADILRAQETLKALLREEGYIFTSVGAPQVGGDGAGSNALTFPILGVTITGLSIAFPDLEEGEVPEASILERVEAIAAPLRGKSNPVLTDLERVSLLATDLPGVRRATFVPEAGDNPGEIRLSLNLSFQRLAGVVFADNRQAPSLGPILAGGIVSWNAWGPYAATTELAAFNSLSLYDGELDASERHTLQFKQRFHFGPENTMAEVGGLWSASQPGDELEGVGLESREIRFFAQAEHQFLRTRALSLWLSAGFSWTDSITETEAGSLISHDVLSVAFIKGRMTQRDADGYTLASAEVRVGLPIIGANDGDEGFPSRRGATGEFVSFRADVERSHRLSDEFSLFGRASFQLAGEPLLSGEQISAGGSLYAKGYDPSEATGDYGAMFYGELRYDREWEHEGHSFGTQFYAFADHAELRRHDDDAFGAAGLSSAGAGVRFDYENARLELEVAQPLSDKLERTSAKNPRFFFSLTQRF